MTELFPNPEQRPLEVTNCVRCGRIVDMREINEGGDKFGSCIEGDTWVCSVECFDDYMADAGQTLEGAPEGVARWVWYGEDETGLTHLSFGRWAKHPCQLRYKLAAVQPTEHDNEKELEP